MTEAPSPGLRVGFIGLGSQGAPMARRIVDAGYLLTIWARRPESLEPFADTAASVAESPAALGAASDVVGLCVFGDDDVREVATGPAGVLAGLASGGTLIIHSTVHPDTCVEMGELAAARGVDVLDAPVSGGAGPAAAGTLTVMVGGAEPVYARVEPVLRTFGDPVRLLGPLGSGAITKLVNNFLFTATMGLAEEALRLAAALGADRAAVDAMLSTGSGRSFALDALRLGDGGLAGFMDRAGRLLEKDAAIMRAVAARAGVELRALGAANAQALE